MKNKEIYIITALIILGGGYIIYNKYKKNKEITIPLTKVDAISVIVNSKKASNPKNVLSTFGEDYLLAWASAIQNGEITFELDGKVYNVEGGKRLK